MTSINVADIGSQDAPGQIAFKLDSFVDGYCILSGVALVLLSLLRIATTGFEVWSLSGIATIASIMIGILLMIACSKKLVLLSVLSFGVFGITKLVSCLRALASSGSLSREDLALCSLGTIFCVAGLLLIRLLAKRSSTIQTTLFRTSSRMAVFVFLLFSAYLALNLKSIPAVAAAVLGKDAIVDVSGVMGLKLEKKQVSEKRQIRVFNLSHAQPLSLIGYRSSCSCLTIRDFPVEVPPLSSKLVDVYFESDGRQAKTEDFETSKTVNVGLMRNVKTMDNIGFSVTINDQASK